MQNREVQDIVIALVDGLTGFPDAVEAVYRQSRKLTNTRGGCSDDNSLLKLLYLGIRKASKKWRAYPTKCFGYHANT